MSNFSGFAIAAVQMGIQSVVIKPVRGFYKIQKPDGAVLPNIIAQAVIEESHSDELEISEHPVEQGAAISDHAFKRPAELTLHLGWSNSPSSSGSLLNSAIGAAAAVSPVARKVAGAVSAVKGVQSLLSGSKSSQINAIYQQLLQMQADRAIFVVYTGKRMYTNMVCKSLSTTTDSKSANSMLITMVCRQVILVNTNAVVLPKDKQQTPAATAAPVKAGSKQLVEK